MKKFLFPLAFLVLALSGCAKDIPATSPQDGGTVTQDPTNTNINSVNQPNF